ncbi:MAG: type I-E CRISPR-associated protein Cas5/CasD [Myxococcales bacterium]|nr:type I-E CRISPR-associated protein Cas5/CasD [Myxococcales bacterium]
MRWLKLNLEAPLSAFGGVVVDGLGVTRDQPALSAITGLLANALGYDRTETGRLAALQSRLLLASAYRAGDGSRLTDFQTAKLAKNDRGWTRWGVEGREGGADTYDSPALTYRDYHADRPTICVVGLRDDGDPDLDALAAALDRPERPLFIGRKSCLPAGSINGGLLEAENAMAALRACVPGGGDWRVSLPVGQGAPNQSREVRLADLRDWTAGFHSGDRAVIEGKISLGVPA